MATRKDSRGYALKKGESQRKDGRYVFRYTTIRGEHRAVYAKDLSELRKKEVKIRRAIEDGLDPDRAERITLNELFDEYISQKYDLKQSTLTNYKYMYNHYVRESFGKLRISSENYAICQFYAKRCIILCRAKRALFAFSAKLEHVMDGCRPAKGCIRKWIHGFANGQPELSTAKEANVKNMEVFHKRIGAVRGVLHFRPALLVWLRMHSC